MNIYFSSRIPTGEEEIAVSVETFNREFVSEHFEIPELLSCVDCDDKELMWFRDKCHVYVKGPDHFFALLIHAIFIENVFSSYEKVLCYFLLRVQRSQKFNLMQQINKFFPSHTQIAKHLYERGHYDLLISLFLNDHKLLLLTHQKICVSGNGNGLELPFYRELVSDLHCDGIGCGLANFSTLLDYQKTENAKSIMLSRILLLSDKGSDDVLFRTLNKFSDNEVSKKELLLKLTFDKVFNQKIHLYNFENDDLNRIYQQNLFIFSHCASLNLNFDSNHYILRNEIYFGPEDNLTDDFILRNSNLIDDFIKCSVQANRSHLLSRLLRGNFNDENFNLRLWNRIKVLHGIFGGNNNNNNLSSFFKFYLNYPERERIELCHDVKLFEEILKFYAIQNLNNLIYEKVCPIELRLKAH